MNVGNVFAHEWAHYRYGVFDEYPRDGKWVDATGQKQTCSLQMDVIDVFGTSVPVPNGATASLMSITSTGVISICV